MSQLLTKVSSKTLVWTLNKRYKVGSSTSHNGSNWTNLTGHNSEPGVGSDWKLVGPVSAKIKQQFEAGVGGQSVFEVTNGELTDNYELFIDGNLQVDAFSSRNGQEVTLVAAQNEGTIIHIID